MITLIIVLVIIIITTMIIVIIIIIIITIIRISLLPQMLTYIMPVLSPSTQVLGVLESCNPFSHPCKNCHRALARTPPPPPPQNPNPKPPKKYENTGSFGLSGARTLRHFYSLGLWGLRAGCFGPSSQHTRLKADPKAHGPP